MSTLTIKDGKRPEIAVLIDPEDSWGRRVIAGVASECKSLHWELLIAPRDDQFRLRVPRGWDGDGVIAAMRDPKTAAHIRGLKLPTVNVSSWGVTQNWCARIASDDRLRAEFAFRHFRERGHQHFAYFGPASQRYSDTRRDEFVAVLEAAGYTCSLFEETGDRRGWNSIRRQVSAWLATLARPLAILTADPHPAILLSQVCRAEGIRVPTDVAILAGDSDDLLCELATPPISSVVLASERIGAQSVQILDGLLQGKPSGDQVVYVPPIRIAERQSTDVLAFEDSFFVTAVHYIRDHAHKGIQVGDVLKVVPISRRQLEQKFQRTFQRSPAEEIRRVKIETAKRLLTTTSISVSQIAQAAGFASNSRFCIAFRQMTGQTPMGFRDTYNRGRSFG